MLGLQFSLYKMLSYNSLLEVMWNMLPIICLCWMSIPSFSLLYMMDDSTSVEFIISVMGNQWYWSYEFTLYDFDVNEFKYSYEISEIAENFDLFAWLQSSNVEMSKQELSHMMEANDFSKLLLSMTLDEVMNEGDFSYKFDSSLMVEDDIVSEEYGLRLLEVDQSLNILQNMTTCFLISSTDVLHSWAVPSFGMKSDACPGSLNSVMISINSLGVFYGQCSEICGIYHAFMPMVVTVSDSFE